ncbi:MAG: NrfD/PsrC family molybdoenzyme membrane anchor subunit [Candidatus Baltobacteraceae bacterium]
MSDALDLRALSPDAANRGASSGDDTFPTYYEQPLLKRPHWGWEVVTYLFVGGIAGGSGMLIALADRTAGEDAALARNARYLSLALAAASPVILIKHLGRPERFHHMLRVVKFKSPMSMGVWGLIAFSAASSRAALAQAARDGLVPGWLAFLGPRWFTNPAQALVGAFLAGYTGVLISATAIPLWAKGKRHIPAASVCSGFGAACAANAALLALRNEASDSQRKLERVELVAGLAELAILLDFRRSAGALGAPMFDGARGRKLTNATLLGGIVLPALLNVLPFHPRWKTIATSALTLFGGYALRESFIEAGKTSADDPRAAFRQPE